jgi:hypothetical protein
LNFSQSVEFVVAIIALYLSSFKTSHGGKMKKGSIIFSGFLHDCDAGKSMYANRRLHFLHGLTPIRRGGGGGDNILALQHHRKRKLIEILFYRRRRTQENKTKENKKRILLSHRVFCMQRSW